MVGGREEEYRRKRRKMFNIFRKTEKETRQSNHCGFCIYFFDNSFDQSKSMVRLVRAEKMVLSGLVTLLITIEHIKRLKNIIGLG